ncbi:HAD hydrolase-like protein [Virus Rctr197k]|nr:HAD hydrolase-like protein [Virus Rctr197k]
MNPFQAAVRDFHRVMDAPAPDRPKLDLSTYRFELRAKLILEEALEFIDACGCFAEVTPDDDDDGHYMTVDGPHETPNWSEMIDALCDIMYVTVGAAIEMGIDLQPFFDLVHEANMKKAAGPVREDGKKLKPPGWQPPDIQGLLTTMLEKQDG